MRTTGPGTHLLPFRSTLLEAANFAAKNVAVRPVAMDYGAVAGEIGWYEHPGKENVLRLLGRKGTLILLDGQGSRVIAGSHDGLGSSKISNLVAQARGGSSNLKELLLNLNQQFDKAVKDKKSSGALAGFITLFVLILIVAGVVFAIVFVSRRRKRRREQELAELKASVYEDVTRLGEDISSLNLDVRDPRLDPAARDDYQRAMDELGLSTEGLVGASPRPSDVAMGGELFARIVADVPGVTAVFTCNDDLALGTLFECQRRGLRVPDDIAIIGFNDLDFCVAAVPTLSSVSTERRAMGTWAAQAVLDLIRGSGKRPPVARVDIGFSIKKRGSTALAPAAALGEPLPDQLFGLAGAWPAIAVGCVEEVDALVMCSVHQREGVGLLGRPAEVHGTEAEAGNRKAGTAQMGELHETWSLIEWGTGRRAGRGPVAHRDWEAARH